MKPRPRWDMVRSLPNDAREAAPLVRALPAPPSTAAELDAIQRAWTTAWDEARRTWPTVELSEELVAPWIASRLPPGEPPAEGLSALFFSELYLACGCVHGRPEALRAFEQTYGGELAAAARRGGAAQADEIVQRLRVRLLVGPEARLHNYAGTGSLKRWLKIACRRLAIDAGRAERSRTHARQRAGRSRASSPTRTPSCCC